LRAIVQVLWVDRLTPEEFRNGFGSHTPMFSGQTKCVRYYMNCTRALKLFAGIIQKQGYVVNADNKQVTMSARQLKAVAAVRPCPLWRSMQPTWLPCCCKQGTYFSVVAVYVVSAALLMWDGVPITLTRRFPIRQLLVHG
jgi:hypothetical protein